MPPRRTRKAAAVDTSQKSPSPEPEAIEEPPAKRAKKTTVTVAEEAEEEANVQTEGLQDKEPDTVTDGEVSNGAQEPDDEEEEEWDPSEERLPGETGKQGKGKEKAQDEPSPEGEKKDEGDTKGWQAVWAPEQNAYYFWNSTSGEVTWTNPLAPPPLPQDASQPPLPNEPPPLPAGPAPTASAPAAAAPEVDPHNQFGQLPEIDPALALLLPPSQRGPGGADAHLVQQATFNSRTGRFTPLDYQYTVGHLDEYNRAKRMNSHYFDVDAWERQKAEESERKAREEANGGKRSTTTRKDMDRYRKKAAEKKQRNQAWLRE